MDPNDRQEDPQERTRQAAVAASKSKNSPDRPPLRWFEYRGTGTVRDALVAIQFLTRFPTPKDLGVDATVLARSAAWFPLVGLLLAAWGTIWDSLVALAGVSPSLRAILLWMMLSLATGAFHEDGLADSADGLGGGLTKERKLTIMRDSRIGSYGAVALILLYALRICALSQLAPHHWFSALACALSVGRWTTIPLLLALPYARGENESGLAKPMVENISVWGLLFSTLCTASVLFLCSGMAAFVGWSVAGGLMVAATRLFRRTVGGVTGDLLGAANVTAEITMLLILSTAKDWN